MLFHRFTRILRQGRKILFRFRVRIQKLVQFIIQKTTPKVVYAVPGRIPVCGACKFLDSPPDDPPLFFIIKIVEVRVPAQTA